MHYFVTNRNEIPQADGVLCVHKLAFFLQHWTFTDNFPVGVVTRDKVNCLAANRTACTAVSMF